MPLSSRPFPDEKGLASDPDGNGEYEDWGQDCGLGSFLDLTPFMELGLLTSVGLSLGFFTTMFTAPLT